MPLRPALFGKGFRSLAGVFRSQPAPEGRVLGLSGRHPEQLRWPLTITDDFAAITAAELTALAAAHLGAEQAAVVIVRPDKGR